MEHLLELPRPEPVNPNSYIIRVSFNRYNNNAMFMIFNLPKHSWLRLSCGVENQASFHGKRIQVEEARFLRHLSRHSDRETLESFQGDLSCCSRAMVSRLA
ncbi:hypothetical protein HanRHA438_Chr05g0213151 [Helianthus annuus]|nr:hypothetical protein HanRHA438_Chr05g0213151 [Helianthus annuus]